MFVLWMMSRLLIWVLGSLCVSILLFVVWVNMLFDLYSGLVMMFLCSGCVMFVVLFSGSSVIVWKLLYMVGCISLLKLVLISMKWLMLVFLIVFILVSSMVFLVIR